jgi:hypothetical protein
MRIINEFFTFCAKFVKLTSLAKVPLSEWKYELNYKLIITFRQAVLVYYLDEFRDFEGCGRSVLQRINSWQKWPDYKLFAKVNAFRYFVIRSRSTKRH